MSKLEQLFVPCEMRVMVLSVEDLIQHPDGTWHLTHTPMFYIIEDEVDMPDVISE